MARNARERQPGCVYLVEQSCAKGKCLMVAQADETAFLKILDQLKRTFAFKLFGIQLDSGCIRLLLCPQKADISSVMRSLLIQFAHYKAEKGPLYRERYKSTCLMTKGSLLQSLVEMKHSTIAVEKGLLDAPAPLLGVDETAFAKLLEPDAFASLDTEWLNAALCNDSAVCCVNSSDQGKKALEQRLADLGLPENDLRRQKALRNELVIWFRQNSTLTLKEIGIILGNLSESTVSKILKSKP